VLLQDFTGVPAVVDLAAMRDALAALGGDPQRINPLQPVDLVIDHSVQVDEYGSQAAFLINTDLEFERNKERYVFLRWGQDAFKNFRVVPPGTGICHQVNLEYLGKTVFVSEENGEAVAYPDSLVGTDSHTTMINGLGVLGWGVGGIEAEAAMLGQPVSMLIPEVVGFKLHGKLPPGATATDLVLTVTEMLRKKKVVGKFVEFYGTGLSSLPLADRATIANMAPEYGATMGFFPADEETLKYLRLSGRSDHHVALVEAYTKAQGLFRTDDTADPVFTDTIELDLGTVEPSLAGPKRPQDRVPLSKSKAMYREALDADLAKLGAPAAAAQVRAATAVSAEPELAATAVLVAGGEETQNGAKVEYNGQTFTLRHGSVVIAAITSCTNTSNPSVMLAAGLLARAAVKKGLKTKPWVKTSLAPGSKVVTDYLRQAGVQEYLDQAGLSARRLRLHRPASETRVRCPSQSLRRSRARSSSPALCCRAIETSRDASIRSHASTISRLRRSSSHTLSPAEWTSISRAKPIGVGKDGPVFLRDIWPTPQEVQDEVLRSVKSEFFKSQYADVFNGDDQWRSLDVPSGETYAWDADSTYVKNPPYFEGMTMAPPGIRGITGARALAVLGDSITTDHISPAGNIPASSPAGKWLIAHGVEKKDFNSYGARRGNHEVMMRGTFANIRLRNEMVPGTEGGWSTLESGGAPQPIYDIAMSYQNQTRRSSSSPARSTERARHATGRQREPSCSAFEP
jgi:aconitate hydratase